MWLIILAILQSNYLIRGANPMPTKLSRDHLAPLSIVHGPILQAPSDTGVTITWATSRKCVSRVEYRNESSTQWMIALPCRNGLIEADVTHHNVALTGLTPGTRYLYRLVSREIVDFKFYNVTFGETIISDEYLFTSFNNNKTNFSFITLNDRHEKVNVLVNSLKSVKWTNIDLVFLNGDMVNGVKDEIQLYESIIDPCSRFFSTAIPLIYVRGNHDTRGSFARQLLDYFPTDSGRYYYTLNHGSVAFLVLDCGEDKGDENPEYFGLTDFAPYMRRQAEWLAQVINEPAFQSARFRICFLHIPPYKKPDPKFIRPQWLADNFIPLLNRGKIDLLISAHTHHYAVYPIGFEGMDFPMIIGSTETVIQCDVSPESVSVSASDLSGKALPQLKPIKTRGAK